MLHERVLNGRWPARILSDARHVVSWKKHSVFGVRGFQRQIFTLDRENQGENQRYTLNKLTNELLLAIKIIQGKTLPSTDKPRPRRANLTIDRQLKSFTYRVNCTNWNQILNLDK